jgi:hypothetical protein
MLRHRKMKLSFSEELHCGGRKMYEETEFSLLIL